MQRQRVSWVKFILVSHIRVHLTTLTRSNEVCHIFVHPRPPILHFYFREFPPDTSMPYPRTFMILKYPFPLVFFLANHYKRCVRPLLGLLLKVSSSKEVFIRLHPNPFCLFLCLGYIFVNVLKNRPISNHFGSSLSLSVVAGFVLKKSSSSSSSIDSSISSWYLPLDNISIIAFPY